MNRFASYLVPVEFSMIAQHLMIAATGHPFVFPHRFDIEYIMTLKRNGSSPALNQRYVEKTVAESNAFSSALASVIGSASIKSSRINPENGFVECNTNDGRILSLKTLFISDKRIKLEREEREFLSPDRRPEDIAFHAKDPRAKLRASFESQRLQFKTVFQIFERSNHCDGSLLKAVLKILTGWNLQQAAKP